MKNIFFTRINGSGIEHYRTLFQNVDTKYAALIFSDANIIPFDQEFEYFLETLNVDICYSDFISISDNKPKRVNLCEYQFGSVRDDFDFGFCVIIRTDAAKKALKQLSDDIKLAGFYALRLQIAANGGKIVHIPQPMYTVCKSVNDDFESKNFSYVDPKNRNYQMEAENVFTNYLKFIGAYLPERTLAIENFDNKVAEFENFISVIIPVKNREKTIGDAIRSALNQQTNFKYNVIIVDNHSTDNTGLEIKKILTENPDKLVHLIPTDLHLGIGGCWNFAVNNPKCGAIAVQLDSDDLYIDQNVLQKIANKFISDKCAMLIGSYQLADFNLNPLPPGVINHSEWTQENGHNNALRINGLGAPRCFFTPLLRQNPLPNVSYGEDYAAAIKITRNYRLSRIFEPLYVCRRWVGNSDNNPSQDTINKNNFYKDFLRTVEIESRRNINNL